MVATAKQSEPYLVASRSGPVVLFVKLKQDDFLVPEVPPLTPATTHRQKRDEWRTGFPRDMTPRTVRSRSCAVYFCPVN